jgi:hypothetical protein
VTGTGQVLGNATDPVVTLTVAPIHVGAAVRNIFAPAKEERGCFLHPSSGYAHYSS